MRNTFLRERLLKNVILPGSLYGTEHVVNGNMESGSPPSSWVAGADTPTLTSVADEHTGGVGSKSLNIQIAVGQSTGVVTQQINLGVGQRFVFSVFGKVVNCDHITVVVYRDDFGVTFVNHDITATAWENYTVEFVSTTATGHIALFAVGAAGQHARLDEVSVRDIQ